MGHILNADREHRLLRQRMDGHTCGVPDSPEILAILKLLYTEDEAALARQIPTQPISLPKLAAKLSLPEQQVEDKMAEMSQRGLMLDIEKGGQRYYALPPVLGGIFEFVMMRARDDVPMKELARLATKAESEAARVAAIKELFDRGFGKAKQSVEMDASVLGSITVQYVTSPAAPPPPPTEEDYETD